MEGEIESQTPALTAAHPPLLPWTPKTFLKAARSFTGGSGTKPCQEKGMRVRGGAATVTHALLSDGGLGSAAWESCMGGDRGTQAQ